MADTPNDASKAGRDHIDITSDVDLHDWAKHFGISPADLIAVVEAVGSLAEDVQRHLDSQSQRPARG
jgi:hypothetical protein